MAASPVTCRPWQIRDTIRWSPFKWPFRDSSMLIGVSSYHLTTNQLKALAELLDQGLDTATAWRIKERLDWIRLAKTPRAARWRITRFIGYAREIIGDSELLEPVRKALATLENHAERVVRRWTSTYTNARMEGLNSLFQAARARARGYRNNRTFITMIYMIASPAGSILKSI
ncbi:transposase [Thiolapillus sp.]|uniref:transposase n=1 Tax=Thiolapillus sp. TaxID=2017437 RepID=UPI003AF54E86